MYDGSVALENVNKKIEIRKKNKWKFWPRKV